MSYSHPLILYMYRFPYISTELNRMWLHKIFKNYASNYIG